MSPEWVFGTDVHAPLRWDWSPVGSREVRPAPSSGQTLNVSNPLVYDPAQSYYRLRSRSCAFHVALIS